MASMTTITCKCGCERQKEVRTADVKRGWGKFFDKSCKARHQERRTRQYYLSRLKQWIDEDEDMIDWYNREGEHPLCSEALGQE